MPKIIKYIFYQPFFWVLFILLSLLLYLLSLLPRIFSGRYYHFLSRVWCRIFIRILNVDLKLYHRNNRTIPEQYILIANHPSALEDFAIPALFDIYPLAKAGVRDWFIIGRISDFAGTIYVKRARPGSRQAALKQLTDAVKQGNNIVIFPEGGCKGARIYKKFHTGAFEISLTTGIPVLPLFLEYVDRDAFVWSGESLPKKLWQIFRARDNRVNYYLHDAISPAGFSDKVSYANYVHSLYLRWQKEYIDT